MAGIPLDDNNGPIIDVRESGEYIHRSFYLNENFEWNIIEDDEGHSCLIPTKK
jgi:hypothetical protein